MATRQDLTDAYETHRMDIVSRLVAYHGFEFADVEDSLQDVVLKTLEKWEICHDTLKNWVPANLPHFLFVATRNRCRDTITRDQTRTHYEELYFGEK